MAETRLEAVLQMEVDQAMAALRKVSKLLGDEIPQAAGRGEDGLNKFTGTIGVLVGRLPKLQTALLKATDPKQIERLNVIIAETQRRINTLSNQGLNKLTSAYSGASGAAINFGRIAQDASFGFLGVANNIEPFILSLKDLRQQTGTTGGAIKAFFSSLAGPAGIGVLIGAVSLFDAYSKGYGVFASRAKEATKQQKTFNEQLQDAKVSALAAGIELQGLLRIASDESNSISVRNSALKELNKTTEDYGIKLNFAKIKSGEAEDAVKKLTSALLEQAVATKFAERIADIRLKIADNTTAWAQATERLVRADNALKNANSSTRDKELGRNNPLLIDRANAEKALADITAERIVLDDQLATAENQYNIARTKSLALTKIDKKEQADANRLAKQIAERYKKGREEIEDFDREFGKVYSATNLSTLERFNLELKQLQEMQMASNTSDEFEQIAVQIALAEQRIEAFKNSTQQLIDTANKIEDAFGFDAMLNFNQDESKTLEALTEMEKTIANIQTAFGLLGPAIDQSFNALANGQNVFDTLGQAIKRLIIDLAKAAALAAILSIATGGATGAGVLIGGTKLKGFADIFKGLLGFRAAGGPVSGGNPYIVGEKGPELFVPENGGRIIPNSSLMNGGGAMGGVLTARVEGSDLLFVLERAQRSAGRRR